MTGGSAIGRAPGRDPARLVVPEPVDATGGRRGGVRGRPGGLLPAFRIAFNTSHSNPKIRTGPRSIAQPPVDGALSPPPAIAVRMVVSAWMFR